MSVSEQNWTRKQYDSWNDAFRGLAPRCRQESVRVAEYTQVLFVGACASSFGRDTADGSARMKSKYADDAYKCGFYHQLGKALVPEEFQVWQKDFSEEQNEIYRRYPKDGRLLVASLQERLSGAMLEKPTRDIPWLMMRESCEQHMERYDGSGFPQGLAGKAISPIAQIVGLAKELDRLACQTLSERPFDEAMAELRAESGSLWSPQLIAVLEKNEAACRNIFEKYIQYSRAIPETVPLVRKRADRPLGLRFRPLLRGESHEIVGYEAIPRFWGILGRDEENEGLDQVEGMLQRADLVGDVSNYFLYELGDLSQRLNTCGVAERVLLMRVMPAYFGQAGVEMQLEQLLEDQAIRRERLLLLVDEEAVLKADKDMEENLRTLLQQGFALVLDRCHPEDFDPERLHALGFRWLCLAPEQYKKTGSAAMMRELLDAGFRLTARDVSDDDTLSWLKLCGVELFGGPLSGAMMTEDEVISDELMRLR